MTLHQPMVSKYNMEVGDPKEKEPVCAIPKRELVGMK